MLEHPTQINITQSELTPRVADYFDNLLSQRDAILASYDLTPETAEQFCDLQSTDEDREKILALYENIVYVLEHKQIPPQVKQEKYRQAQEIMEEEFFGIEAIETAFNIHLRLEDVPYIPFSAAELEKAKALNQFLVLRVDKTDSGSPLTIRRMSGVLIDRFIDRGGDELVIQNDRNEEDLFWRDFFDGETPALSWALVGKEFVPDTESKNYLDQISLIIDYCQNHLFSGKEIPEKWQSAFSEFEKRKLDIANGFSSPRILVGKQVEELAVTKLVRHTPVEAVYDIVVYFYSKGEILWESKSVWTSRCYSIGRMVDVGCFDHTISVRPIYSPLDSDFDLGAVFSRKE